jgi:hypothetical protein
MSETTRHDPDCAHLRGGRFETPRPCTCAPRVEPGGEPEHRPWCANFGSAATCYCLATAEGRIGQPGDAEHPPTRQPRAYQGTCDGCRAPLPGLFWWTEDGRTLCAPCNIARLYAELRTAEASLKALGASDKYELAARLYDREGLRAFSAWASEHWPQHAGLDVFEATKRTVAALEASRARAEQEGFLAGFIAALVSGQYVHQAEAERRAARYSASRRPAPETPR